MVNTPSHGAKYIEYVMKTEYSEYQCPKCGRWSDDETSLVSRSDPEYNYQKDLEFGGNPMDWTEKHKCPSCDTEYEFENSNC